jgi:hypothetical protein
VNQVHVRKTLRGLESRQSQPLKAVTFKAPALRALRALARARARVKVHEGAGILAYRTPVFILFWMTRLEDNRPGPTQL